MRTQERSRRDTKIRFLMVIFFYAILLIDTNPATRNIFARLAVGLLSLSQVRFFCFEFVAVIKN